MALTRKQYIEKIAPAVIDACRGTGLYPSCMIAQAIVESGNGNSKLASVANNHFGIKADKSWKGKVYSAKTREVLDGKDTYITDGFRYYDSLLDGFADRNKFLLENPRYKKAGVFDTLTPQGQAYFFEEAGYATDPNYAEILSKVIDSEGLERFDEGMDKSRPLYVDASGLNFRKAPALGHNIIAVLPNGTKLDLVKGGSSWSLVWSPDVKVFGYVSSDFLKTIY